MSRREKRPSTYSIQRLRKYRPHPRERVIGIASELRRRITWRHFQDVNDVQSLCLMCLVPFGFPSLALELAVALFQSWETLPMPQGRRRVVLVYVPTQGYESLKRIRIVEGTGMHDTHRFRMEEKTR